VDKFLEDWMPRIFRFALRLTSDAHQAEDLAQETMLRAWRQRDSLRDFQSSRVWLFRIATNLWADQLRRRRSPVARAGPLPETAWHAGQSAERALSGREELRLALAALEQLPPRQREVLYMSACEGMKIAEIAEVLDATPDAIKASLSLARKKMRDCLEETILNPTPHE
jgi:RNA polymerase sigma-70 factor, ECF subfamily